MRSLLLAILLGVFHASFTLKVDEDAGDLTQLEPGSNRDPKLLLPVLKFLRFENAMCTYHNQQDPPLMGTCFNRKECRNFKGEAKGTCGGNNAGVCCIQRETCGGSLSRVGYFISPATPSNMCMLTINVPKWTSQIRLDLTSFNIAGPVDGDCSNDTFMISGDVLPGSKLPILCGNNDGQTLFIDVPSTVKNGVVKLTFSLNLDVEVTRNWNIKVSFVTPKDGPMSRCLQQISTVSGMIESFNFGDMTTNQQINDVHYHICFATLEGYCEVDFDFETFDWGQPDANGDCTNDFIEVQGTKFCGTIDNLSFAANNTGPIGIHVKSDGDNSLGQAGFKANFMYRKCTGSTARLLY